MRRPAPPKRAVDQLCRRQQPKKRAHLRVQRGGVELEIFPGVFDGKRMVVDGGLAKVSYFAGAVEAFVPRIVVRPSLGARIAGQDTRRPSPPIAPDAFLETPPERARPMIAQFIDTIESDGGELDWKQTRVRVRGRGDAGPKVAVVAIRPASRSSSFA